MRYKGDLIPGGKFNLLLSENLSDYVRPIITLSLTAVFCWGFVVGMITAEVFVPTAVSILTWWFKSRDEEKKSAQVIEAAVKEVKAATADIKPG